MTSADELPSYAQSDPARRPRHQRQSRRGGHLEFIRMRDLYACVYAIYFNACALVIIVGIL